MADSFPPHMVPVKRRNGKLQSCEPCRTRKLSCDHRLPYCTRCVKRRTPNLCYYHPAPMTRSVAPLPSPDESGIPSPSTSISTAMRVDNLVQTTQSQSQNLRSGSVPLPDPNQKILSVPSAGILFESSDRNRAVGFLGESSSTAVVAELNNSLGINAPELHEPHSKGISEAFIRRGAQILSFFQDQDQFRLSLDRCFSSPRGDGEGYLIFRPVYITWLEHFLPVVHDAIKTNSVLALSAKIWRNTQKPLAYDGSTTALEWALATTGENVRWEVIGLLLSLTGVYNILLPNWNPPFGTEPKEQRAKQRQTVLDFVNLCIEFSKASGRRNDLLAILLYDRFLFVAMLRGDASTESWTNFTEVCDTIVLLGIHLENRVDSQTPFFLCELRIRLFLICFTMDKFQATFLGRPPKLSYRYSVLQEPHDLNDDQMCLDGVGLQAAIAALDNGWNTSGRLTRIAWRKARWGRDEIAEDILEIVIGTQSNDLERRIEQVRQRRNEQHAAMPEFARIDIEFVLAKVKSDPNFRVPGRPCGWTPLDMQALLGYNCFRRHGEFLLERVVFNRRKTDSSRLVASAKSLLGLIMKAYSLQDICWQFRCDLSDMLAFFAVPPAGVLAMEMLKRDQINDPNDTFPRSETLQQLSVLVSALEAVDPEEGNHAICAMGLSAIKKVLDRLLSRPLPRPVAPSSFHYQGPMDGVYIDNDADFLQWMDSVDFDTNAWDPMNIQGLAS